MNDSAIDSSYSQFAMSYVPAAGEHLRSKDGRALYASVSLQQDDRESTYPIYDEIVPPDHDADQLLPRRLRTRFQLVTTFLIDLTAVIVSIAVFTFSVMSYWSRGNLLSSREQQLLDASRILATAFPFIFAFTIGRTVQIFLSWRLEKGVNCLSFAYLNNSFSLASTYLAPFRIRCAHWLPAALMLIWAFSPVGSQGSLRFIYKEQGRISTVLNDPVQYVYTSATGSAICGQCFPEARSAMFLAPFLSITTYKNQAQDPWGNIKTPIIDDLSGPTPNNDGWITIPDQADIEYSGLAGIPHLGSQRSGDTNFLISSWYWKLDNATLWDKESKRPLLEGSTVYKGSTKLTNFTASGLQWQFAIPEKWDGNNSSSIPLTFEITPSGRYILNGGERFGDHLTENDLEFEYSIEELVDNATDTNRRALRLEATAVQQPVELNVTCSASSCGVNAIRKTSFENDYDPLNNVHYLGAWMLDHLGKAFPIEHNGTPMHGVLEAYISDPSQNVYSVLSATHFNIDLTKLNSAKILSRRLSQILNTFWIIDNFFTHAAGALNVSEVNVGPSQGSSYGMVKNSTATVYHTQDFLGARGLWFALLCISSLVMVVGSVSGTVLNLLRLAPDSTGFLSALTLNNGTSILHRGSYLEDDKKVKILRGTKLMVGDFNPNEDVGQVRIGKAGSLGPLEKRRLYW